MIDCLIFKAEQVEFFRLLNELKRFIVRTNTFW